MKVQRNLKLFDEVITAENIEAMSELIAMCAAKRLIGYIGTQMFSLYRSLIDDIINKNDFTHHFGDGYDMVQQVALVLCRNMGRKVTEIHHINKKGRAITIEMQACREMNKIVGLHMRDMRRIQPLEYTDEDCLPMVEIDDEPDCNVYKAVDDIIDALNLDEPHLIALECRMSGMSYPEIGRIIHRATSTAYEYIKAIGRLYMKFHL